MLSVVSACLFLRSALFKFCSYLFYYHLQGNKGERQRLRRIMDREALKDVRFHKQRSGRTPSGVDVDAEIMQRNVPISSTSDRVFLAFCCPMPCMACRRLRCGSQVPMSCECTFFARSAAARLQDLIRSDARSALSAARNGTGMASGRTALAFPVAGSTAWLTASGSKSHVF